jgi:hypothetical protein
MVNSKVSLPLKCQNYLQQLADNHQVDINSIISELCVWAFSIPEGKKQFEAWLDAAFPPKGAAADKARAAGARERAREEEAEEALEEEVHEDRDYSEDR